MVKTQRKRPKASDLIFPEDHQVLRNGRYKKETYLINDAVEYLSMYGCTCFRHNNTGAYDRRAGCYRKPSGIAYIKGVSDIIGCAPDGRFIALECKSSSDKPTFDQAAFVERIRYAGGIAGVIYTLGDVRRVFKECGLELKGA